MSENQTLRQAENTVVLEGILLEKRLEVKTMKTKDGEKKAITGELDVEVKDNEVHTVRVFSYEKKADGSDNGIFKGLKTVDDEYLSVATHGREGADKVRITQGQVGLNEYYGQDGQLKSFPQLSTNFINRLGAGEEFNPRAEFDVEIMVKAVSEEIKNDEETGRVKITGILPLYGGKVVPFEFVVDSGEGANYIRDNYEAGQTVKIYGDIVNFKEKKVVTEKAAFGKDKEKVTYKTVREYLVTGGSEPYEMDDENSKTFSFDLIKQALVERETYLNELKNKKDHQPKQQEEKKGFGNKGTSEKSEKSKFDSNKLPF